MLANCMEPEAYKKILAVPDMDRGPYITTFTGKKFYPKDPRPEDIDIVDIAHALSFQCRWSGHTKIHFSVGHHSYIIGHLAWREYGPIMGLYGLLHDASEAYIVDIPRPIKHLVGLSGYRDLEKNVEGVILKKYGLTETIPDEILKLDDLLLVLEAEEFMGSPEWCKVLPRLEGPEVMRLLYKPVSDLDFLRLFELLRREAKV